MERFCYPVVFSEELTAVFKLKNISDWHRPKNPKISNFQSFYAFFVKFSIDNADWKVKNGHRSKILLWRSIL